MNPHFQTTYSPSYKHYVTALLLAVYIFNQIDRQVFGILMEPIGLDLSLSDTQLGFLAGPALALFYAVLGIPIARWGDRSHRVNIMCGAIALWSGIVVLTAAAGKFWQLALTRIGVGVGEAGFSAIAQSVLADYHLPAERTHVLSIFMLGIPLGGAASALLGGWVNEAYGWRAVFIAAGAPGILLALLMKWTVAEPPRGISSGAPAVQDSQLPLSSVFAIFWRRRALRHLAIAMALSNLAFGGVLGWQATFFIRLHGMSTGEIGTWLAFILSAGGGGGIWLSGRLMRWLKIKDEQIQAYALASVAVLAWLMLTAALLWPETTGALLLWLVAYALLSFFYAPSFAFLQSLTAARMRATAVAIVIFLQLLFASVIGMQLTGVVSDAFAAHFGAASLRWAMLVMTPAVLWAAVHFGLAGRTIQADLREVDANA